MLLATIIITALSGNIPDKNQEYSNERKSTYQQEHHSKKSEKKSNQFSLDEIF